MLDVIRRNWRFWVALAEILLLTVIITHYLKHRQDVADHRAEVQRRAICAILANIPGQVPAEIVNARGVFARPGHPTDCQMIRHPRATAQPTVTPSPTTGAAPAPQQTVVIIRPAPSASPAPSRTASPHPTPPPRPAPTRTPSPSPTPRPTCHRVVVATICT